MPPGKRRYSDRSADMGSIREARRDGMYPAERAMTARIITVTANVTGPAGKSNGMVAVHSGRDGLLPKRFVNSRVKLGMLRYPTANAACFTRK